MNIQELTPEAFEELPLVVEGESKEVRYAGLGEVVIRLKPTIYSYTHNRTGVIEGSDKVRLQAIQLTLPVLKEAGIEHTYQDVNDEWILSTLVLQPELEGQQPPFLPDDLSPEEIELLPKAPPIEVIAKQRHTGTSKHRYFGMEQYPTLEGTHISPDQPYPEPLVRFDWRNPMHHPKTDERLADEVLPEQMARWYMDTEKADNTARRAFAALSTFFDGRMLQLWDICFFIAEDGTTMFGEVSPDCMRVRTHDNLPVDKDVWRAGGSSEYVLEKWQSMLQMLRGN